MTILPEISAMNNEAWILETPDGGLTGRIAHAAKPWFACSFAESPEAAGEFYGLTVEMEKVFFHGFTWQESIPHEDTLRKLCSEAGQAINAAREGSATKLFQ